MKLFSNKFLISFLILVVLIYSFSVSMAQAKGVASIITAIVLVAVVVTAIIFQAYPLAAAALSKGALGYIVGYGLTIGLAAVTVGQIACLTGTNNPMFTGCGSNNSPQQGVVGSPTLQNQSATAIMSSDGNCTTGYALSYSVTDAYQYGIYRDGNLIKQATLNTIVQPSPYNTSFSYADNNVTPNKDIKYQLILTDKNGKQYRYPEINVYSECIKLDLKMDNKDGARNYFYPRNNATLQWETIAAASCTASGDWSGSRGPASGSENLGYLPRGTSNPGQGKTYNYSLTCQYPKNKTLSDSVSVTIFRYPDCTFTADPDVIEILPATSTLSWNCWYLGSDQSSVNSCSIDQGIGNLTSLPVGSVDVRPSQETTYTMTCDSIDKTTDYQASVKVGFKPRVREIIPR
ncbi:MAG: hypothetical protein M1170_02750 [Patescibacteria group bacterium]|nr:hypothetical protein [Patescibacteria group bacterium]